MTPRQVHFRWLITLAVACGAIIVFFPFFWMAVTSLKTAPEIQRVPLQIAQKVNEVWSMDFVSDSLSNGRRIKCLTVADDFSHECVDIVTDYGIGGQYVTRLLDRAAIFRGYPSAVRTDNGPEFTSRAFIRLKQIKHLQSQGQIDDEMYWKP